MKRTNRLLAKGLLMMALANTAGAGELRDYVARDDSAFSWEIHETVSRAGASVHLVELTSQEWRGITWTHWLSVVVPETVRHPDRAILMVAGGRNRPDPPDARSREAQVFTNIAVQTGAPVAILQQVPNQPLYEDLTEDALIAHTFDRYLEEGDADWPLLLPMVKSAVRAMDALTEIGAETGDFSAEQFVVMGASKRGWTSWLTAAVDSRVSAVVPMVIDMLNIGPQLDRQKKSYGGYSEMISDYEDYGIIERFDTPDGRRLSSIIDPYAYRRDLTLPKLVVLGTNDPYWTVDASSLYLNDLKGETHLHYAANAGHSLDLSIIPTVLGFLQLVLNDQPRPELQWERDSGNRFSVSWNPAGRAEAYLWEAESSSRDFREAQWRSRRLVSENGEAELEFDPPQQGWSARYVEVRFPNAAGGFPLNLSTTITVLSAGETAD